MRWLDKKRLMTRMAAAAGRRRHAEVIQICGEILGLDRRDVAALTMKATSLAKLGASDEAAEAWRALLEIEPRNFTALRALTDFHRNEGETRLACTYAQRAIRAHDPGSFSEADFRFIGFLGRLFGKNDLSEAARKDATAVDAEEAKWLAEVREFIDEECEELPPAVH